MFLDNFPNCDISNVTEERNILAKRDMTTKNGKKNSSRVNVGTGANPEIIKEIIKRQAVMLDSIKQLAKIVGEIRSEVQLLREEPESGEQKKLRKRCNGNRRSRRKRGARPKYWDKEESHRVGRLRRNPSKEVERLPIMCQGQPPQFNPALTILIILILMPRAEAMQSPIQSVKTWNFIDFFHPSGPNQ